MSKVRSLKTCTRDRLRIVVVPGRAGGEIVKGGTLGHEVNGCASFGNLLPVEQPTDDPVVDHVAREGVFAVANHVRAVDCRGPGELVSDLDASCRVRRSEADHVLAGVARILLVRVLDEEAERVHAGDVGEDVGVHASGVLPEDERSFARHRHVKAGGDAHTAEVASGSPALGNEEFDAFGGAGGSVGSWGGAGEAGEGDDDGKCGGVHCVSLIGISNRFCC